MLNKSYAEIISKVFQLKLFWLEFQIVNFTFSTYIDLKQIFLLSIKNKPPESLLELFYLQRYTTIATNCTNTSVVTGAECRGKVLIYHNDSMRNLHSTTLASIKTSFTHALKKREADKRQQKCLFKIKINQLQLFRTSQNGITTKLSIMAGIFLFHTFTVVSMIVPHIWFMR